MRLKVAESKTHANLCLGTLCWLSPLSNLSNVKIEVMPWYQVKHNLLCSSMLKFGGSWYYKQPQLLPAHQGWGFWWGQEDIDPHGEPDVCLMLIYLLAKVLLFLGWAEFCQLLSSVKFTAFAEASGVQGGGNTSALPSTG